MDGIISSPCSAVPILVYSAHMDSPNFASRLKQNPPATRPVTVKLPILLIEQMDAACTLYEVTRIKFMSEAIKAALEDIAASENGGQVAPEKPESDKPASNEPATAKAESVVSQPRADSGAAASALSDEDIAERVKVEIQGMMDRGVNIDSLAAEI